MKLVGGHGWGSVITEQPRASTPAQGLAGRHSASAGPRASLRRATGTPREQRRARDGLGERGCPSRGPGLRAPFPPPIPSRGPRSPRAQSRSGAGRAARASPPRRYRAPPPRQGAAGRGPRAEWSGPLAMLPEPNGAIRGPCPRAERPHLPGGFLRAAGRLIRHLASPFAQPWRRPSERRSHRARERRARSRWPSRRWPAPPGAAGPHHPEAALAQDM